MNVEQLALDFDAQQDRLLLTVHVHNAPSVRVWLTRRYVRLLLSALSDMVAQQVRAQQPLAAGSPALMGEFLHEEVAGQLDLTQPPLPRHVSPAALALPGWTGASLANDADDAHAAPLGWLAHEVRTSWQDKGTPQQRPTELAVLPVQGQGLTFHLTDGLVHVLLRLLTQSCQAAEWGLEVPAFASTPALDPAQSAPSGAWVH